MEIQHPHQLDPVKAVLRGRLLVPPKYLRYFKLVLIVHLIALEKQGQTKPSKDPSGEK